MTQQALVALGLWLVIGAGTAAWMRARGAPTSSCAAAVVAWPLMVHLLRSPAAEASAPGPLGAKIQRSFERLDELVAREAFDSAVWTGDLAALRVALESADQRLAVVDRILADAAEDRAHAGVDASLAELSARRDRAAAEVDAVLAELARLRLKIGAVALSGDAMPVRDGLRSLTSRVRAADELSRLVDP
jgi:hypothetical protein